MRALLVFPLMILAAMAARADVPMGSHTAFESRFGPVAVVRTAQGPALRVHGQDIALRTQADIIIRAGFALADEAHDWVLVGQGSGGRGCPPPITILQVSADRVAMSEAFGACVHMVHAVNLAPGQISVHLPNRAMPDQSRVYTFDGQRLIETSAAAPPPRDLTPAEIAAWEGSYRILQEIPTVRAALRDYVEAWDEPEMLTRLEEASGVRPALFRRGDWIFQQGCRPRACNLARGIIGVRISDGAVVAALLEQNGQGAFFGPHFRDPVFRALVEEHRPD